MKTHYVNCKDCGKDIAQWGGGMNFQKAHEYVCQGKIEVECSKENVFYDPKTKERSHVYLMDGGAGTLVETPPGCVKLQKEMRSCAGTNDTTYCEDCAKKHRLKCPICGAKLKLERKSWYQ